MVGETGLGYRIFKLFNFALLTAMALLSILPFVHVLAVSLSSKTPASSGAVTFWPIHPNFESYKYALSGTQFWKALWVSVERVVLGGIINFLLTVLTAYPLSKESSTLKGRTPIVWFFFFSMLFSGGLVPWYFLLQELHLTNSIWGLVLPGALPIFNAILLLNFIRQLPKEMEEAALVDGAGYWATLWRIIVPVSLPALATVTLFSVIGHWNSWFDGLILMNSPDKYPLQSYIQTTILSLDVTKNMNEETLNLMVFLSDRTVRAANLLLAALPIILFYPFLQRFFVKGIVIGSVKG